MTLYYRYLHGKNRTLVCDLGCKHTATLHEVVEIEKVGERLELIKGLHYDKDGYGKVWLGEDIDGNTYTKTPNWDGMGPWVRDDGDPHDELVYWNYPIIRGDIALNVDNNEPIG